MYEPKHLRPVGEESPFAELNREAGRPSDGGVRKGMWRGSEVRSGGTHLTPRRIAYRGGVAISVDDDPHGDDSRGTNAHSTNAQSGAAGN